ncbi:hypothetical protein VTN00DRAFT_4146 [Thermoascus crustaceus]|uniref:uncharacterized protein n=1 Tax=Thermoascus crustaceus TaxID=5088 RepID=UPI003743342E
MKRGLASGELLSLLGSHSVCSLVPTLIAARRHCTARFARQDGDGDWKLTEWQVDSSDLRSPGHARSAKNASFTCGPATDLGPGYVTAIALRSHQARKSLPSTGAAQRSGERRSRPKVAVEPLHG